MGVWYSTDSGSSWTQSASVTGPSSDPLFPSRSIVALALSPAFASDATVFALSNVSPTEGSIYKSTNGGQTFALLRTVAAPGTSLAISPSYSTDGKVFAGFNSLGLWYTYNWGGNWSQDPTWTRMRYPFALAISPSFGSDGYLFVGGYAADYGPFQRWSGPGSWTSFNSGLSLGDIILSLAIRTSSTLWAGTATHGMFYTASGGSSWTGGCDNVVGTTVPAVLSLAVSLNSGPVMLLEGRIDRLYEATGSPLGGAGTCTASTPIAMNQCVTFERLWDDSTHCDIFVGTDAGLFKKTCPVPLGFSGPKGVDGRAVALAEFGHGAFLGSAGSGLFKAQARDLGASGNRVWTMVQYDNFPNKLTPSIVAICLDPAYDETSTGCGDNSTLFVAAMFPGATLDNGVYKSTNFGNTWTKLTGGTWPGGTVNLYDLAISPHYREGSSDTTLFAATDKGLYRWDGGTTYWTNCTNDPTYPVYYRIGLAPTYSRTGGGTWDQTIFVAADDTKNGPGIWYNRYSGDPSSGRWTRLGVYSDTGCNQSPSYITGFAFPFNFGRSGGTTRIFVSNSSIHCNSVDTSVYPWTTWYHLSDGLPSSGVGANGIAAHPSFDENTSRRGLILATPRGPYYGTFDNSNPLAPKAGWTRSYDSYPSLSITYDQSGGSLAMVGVSAPYPNDPTGGIFSNTSGLEFRYPFTGFNTLPDDIFQTIAGNRLDNSNNLVAPNLLFASSPSMGVFISENKGLTFRPWDLTNGGCAVRDAYGLVMTPDRGGANWDVIWLGGDNSGIKYRYIYWNSSAIPPSYSLDTCGACFWYNTNLTSGRFERFTALGTGITNPIFAASPARGTISGLGIYALTGYAGNTWNSTSSPGSDSPSVRFGYAPLVTAMPLSSGVVVGGQSVTNTTWNYYSIQVPAGTASLVIQMTPATADPDIYVRFGDIPDLNTWDYRPYSGGTTQETVTVAFPAPGIWYIGVRDYLAGSCTYSIVATTSNTPPVAGGPAKPVGDGSVKAEVNGFEAVPIPKAPNGATVWGTVNRSGVIYGTGSPFAVTEALSWEYRNGAAPYALSNLDTQTVAQLKDGTLVAGCLGDAFYSPQPDAGRTTWISSTANIAGTCSYDFRDLFEINLNPLSDTDLRSDCLIAAYGTGASTSGGVWLSGDKGHHWMKISSGFDPNSQKLNSLAADVLYPLPPSSTTSYYSSTDGTGVYTRTITLQPYPTVTSLSGSSGGVGGGGTITITGTGFSNTCPTGTAGDCPNSGPVAIFGVKPDGTDNEAVTTYLDSNHLSAVVPAHTAGSVPVTVRNPDTRRSVTSATYAYSCSGLSPSGLGAITAIDLDPYSKTGVQIAWPADPLAWNDGAGSRTYRVLRGATAGTLSPLLGATIAYGATPIYTDTTALAGVTYYYAVRYSNGCTYSADTTAVTATDQALVPPEAGATPATALKWSSSAKNQLCWGTATGGTGYNIYKGDNALQPVSSLVAGVTACMAYHAAGVGSPPCSTANLNDSPVTPGDFYWYLLDAYNVNGEGPLDPSATYKVSSGGDCPLP